MALVVACFGVSLGLAQEEGMQGPAEAGEARSPALRALPLPLPDTPSLRAVRGWANPYGHGLELATDHYALFTTLLDPDLLAMLPAFMESAHRAYNAELPHPIRPRERSTIYLFADRPQWEAFTRDLAGPQAGAFLQIRDGAYCLNGVCAAYDLGPERTLAALAHEGWHQFTSRHFAFRLPSWLDEGVAATFEGFTWIRGGAQFHRGPNAYRLGPLRDAGAAGTLLPLDVLLATSPGEAMALDRSARVQTFYGQAYALALFLQQAEGRRYLAGYRRLMADGLAGRWPLESLSRAIAADRNMPKTVDWNRIVGPRLFRYYVTHDLQGFQQRYQAFCAQLAGR
jgi:hypothetical protein